MHEVDFYRRLMYHSSAHKGDQDDPHAGAEEGVG
jgi:hypothetical protein